MKKVLAAMLVGGLLAGVAQAALLANWADPTVITINDAADNGAVGNNTRAISSLSAVHQDGGYYFLMTLAAAPQAGLDNFAQSYMINIDNAAGGADYGVSSYVAGFPAGQQLTGIDLIIDAHYDVFNSIDNHYHTYQSPVSPDPQFTVAGMGGVGSYQTDGSQLEWFIADAYLSGSFTVYGSTLDVNTPVSYDITGPLTVPEPTSMALLALGAAALGLRRKFRA